MKGKTIKIKAGDLNYDIKSSYTADLFTKLLHDSNIYYEVKSNYDYGYRVIVPVYCIDGYREIDKLLDYAIASTLDI